MCHRTWLLGLEARKKQQEQKQVVGFRRWREGGVRGGCAPHPGAPPPPAFLIAFALSASPLLRVWLASAVQGAQLHAAFHAVQYNTIQMRVAVRSVV